MSLTFIRKSERGDYEIAAGVIVLVVILILGIGGSIIKNSHRETLRGCVVESKDRTRNSDGKSDMRIYTKNCGVLQVQDTLIGGQMDSSDVYASIKEGKAYDFTAAGWRVPLFSMFQNIVHVEEAK